MQFSKKAHFITVFILLSIVVVGSYLYNSTSYLREAKSYPVVLTEAYSTTLNVGKSNTKEVFRGRLFHAESNLILDRSIDGFYYQRFLDGGKKPLAGTLNLSRVELGEEVPAYAVNGLIFSTISGVFLALYSFLFLFGFFNNYDSYSSSRYNY